MNIITKSLISILIVLGLFSGHAFADQAKPHLNVVIKKTSTCHGVMVSSKTAMGMKMVYTQRMKEGYKKKRRIICYIRT